jgi:steroid delta-isomerase-like uncharacterized protein
MGEALDAVNHFYSAFADGKMDVADEVFAENCKFVMPPGPMSKAEHRALGDAFKAAFPDSRMVVEHTLDGGDEVFVEGRFRGTQTGPMETPQGTIPATGKKIDLRFGDYFKAAGGLITDHRTYWDQAEMATQLGLTPG